MNIRRCTCSIAALALPALACGAGAATVTLNSGNSIQAAVNSGLYDEIVLQPGTYQQLVDFGGAAITRENRWGERKFTSDQRASGG